jgi:hypothetical protein
MSITAANYNGSSTLQYVVLIDTGCDWPDVVFVGSWEDAVAFDRGISDEHATSVQAVVTLDEAKEASC